MEQCWWWLWSEVWMCCCCSWVAACSSPPTCCGCSSLDIATMRRLLRGRGSHGYLSIHSQQGCCGHTGRAPPESSGDAGGEGGRRCDGVWCALWRARRGEGWYLVWLCVSVRLCVRERARLQRLQLLPARCCVCCGVATTANERRPWAGLWRSATATPAAPPPSPRPLVTPTPPQLLRVLRPSRSSPAPTFLARWPRSSRSCAVPCCAFSPNPCPLTPAPQRWSIRLRPLVTASQRRRGERGR